MSKQKHIILGVHIQDRVKNIPDIQKLFTQYGCNIKTRLGLHEASGSSCSAEGVILLDTTGQEESVRELAAELNSHEGIEVQLMVFDHH